MIISGVILNNRSLRTDMILFFERGEGIYLEMISNSQYIKKEEEEEEFFKGFKFLIY